LRSTDPAQHADPPNGTGSLGVVVPAAGSGRRMGGVQKQFLELAGLPVLHRALLPFLAHPRLVAVVVALPPEDAARPPGWLTSLDPRLRVVAGGSSRGESVFLGLAGLPEVDVAMVHDGARPLVSIDTVDRCFRRAVEGVGAVAGVPAVDTMKTVGPDRRILATPDREHLWHAHTPQAFPAHVLREAYALAQAEGFPATDDAALVERLGLPVEMVPGNPENLKVTRSQDVAVAEALLGFMEGA
jgi:2-C-methyl-D-erythritol 4-phosphate cytidylyltransferase